MKNQSFKTEQESLEKLLLIKRENLEEKKKDSESKKCLNLKVKKILIFIVFTKQFHFIFLQERKS
jgi:hypothetical protein